MSQYEEDRMKFQTAYQNLKTSKLKFLIVFFFLLSACATIPQKTYEEAVSEWKSYKDVAKWMSWNFSYDMNRLDEGLRKYSHDNPMPVRSPQETYRLKTGVCFDAARFAQETLNRIAASYRAEIVYIVYEDSRYFKGSAPTHYVCSFWKDGKLYIMDYGTTAKSLMGIHGPYNSLDEYKKFCETWHPSKRKIKSISFGWPEAKKKVLE